MKDNTKNATLTFSCYYDDDDRPDVDLTLHCNADLYFTELLDYFKRFAIALSFSPTTVEKFLGEE